MYDRHLRPGSDAARGEDHRGPVWADLTSGPPGPRPSSAGRPDRWARDPLLERLRMPLIGLLLAATLPVCAPERRVAPEGTSSIAADLRASTVDGEGPLEVVLAPGGATLEQRHPGKIDPFWLARRPPRPPDAGKADLQPAAGGDGAGSATMPDAGRASRPGSGKWVVAAEESFESLALPEIVWSKDTVPDDGSFSDEGLYFQKKAVKAPPAYRASAPFGKQGWLSVESYSRSSSIKHATLFSVVIDPARASNKVLRIRSPAHTDATIVRPTKPLPARYRMSLRVGYAQFGDGLAGGKNGYDSGNETAEPWLDADATRENGFYWLAILDALPRPHNNVWIHHHRKVVIDSDNHYPPWMQIWTGNQFIWSGAHPVMIFAVDGAGKGGELTGKPFLSYAAGQWQPSGAIRAADAYRPDRWYKVSIERFDDTYTLEVAGDFKHGGNRVYKATIDAGANCIWHFNNSPLGSASPCVDSGYYPSLDKSHPHWPAGTGWPDYFMFGDPHTNYYEGQVYYDDVKLEVWQQP